MRNVFWVCFFYGYFFLYFKVGIIFDGIYRCILNVFFSEQLNDGSLVNVVKGKVWE